MPAGPHPDGVFKHFSGWESSAVVFKQSQRLLECVEDKERGALFLDLVLTSREELIKEVKTGGPSGL